MARGAFRGAAAAWLGLIALQTFTTKRGAGAVGGLIGTVDNLVKRALDPTVAAIPDHSTPTGVVKPGTGPTPGDSSPHLDSNGKLIPGDPNGAPGGFPTTIPGTQNDRYDLPNLGPVTTNA